MKNVALFAGLTEGQGRRIASAFRRQIYTGIVPLFSRGDAGGQLFIVVKGGFKIYHEKQNGQKTILAIHVVGEVFGETALLHNNPCSHSAVTIADHTELLILQHTELMLLLRESFDLAQALLQNMALQQDAAYEKTALLADNSLKYAAKLLVARTDAATGRLTSPLTQKEFAEAIGVRRETVARNLARLEEAGLIIRNHGNIIVLNVDGLQRLGSRI